MKTIATYVFILLLWQLVKIRKNSSFLRFKLALRFQKIARANKSSAIHDGERTVELQIVASCLKPISISQELIEDF